MTQLNHPEYISKKLTEITATKKELRKDYDAIETHLNAVGGIIDALYHQENSLKKQKTELECAELISKLKTVKVWTINDKVKLIMPLSKKPLIKIIGIDCADRQVKVSVKNRDGVITNPCADIYISFEYVESRLEPLTDEN